MKQNTIKKQRRQSKQEKKKKQKMRRLDANGWPAANVRVTPTTEQTIINERLEKEDVNQEEKKVSCEKHEFLPSNDKKEFFYFVTKGCRNLFCFGNQRNWDSKQEICTTENTNKDFDNEKEIICSDSCPKKRESFFVLKSGQ